MHKLRITNCKNHIEEITLSGGTHTIGRTLDSHFRLEGEEVSRTHATLLVNNSTCHIADANSRNGTFVNGKRLNGESYSLLNGDIIKIGKFNLKFISDSAVPHTNALESSKLITPKTPLKTRLYYLSLLFALVFMLVLSFHYRSLSGIKSILLAERTAQYLAEKNKDALYIGEYNSIDLTNLPASVKQLFVWDKNGVLRAKYPLTANPPFDVYKPIDVLQTNKTGNRLEIYAPILYEGKKIGLIMMGYNI